MSRKKPADKNGFVYSTDPSFQYEAEDHQEQETLPSAQQLLRIKLDTKQRAGKAVTLVSGFIGTNEDLEQLGRQLRNYCGTGGSVKNGEAIVQGDQRDKIFQWLQKNGFTKAKKL
jgi:translation initiation factor 1